MEDPSLAWPAWKFGMKRDALSTTLHDQYNTFQSTIQDPEAFHHDVYDVAVTASTTAEFHQLLAERREQRLRELNESLQSAACEIIANPALVGTDHWVYALQLFRSRSLDSLVRFFSSYLPADHPWRSSQAGVDPERAAAVDDHAKETSHVSEAAAPLFHDTLTHELQTLCDAPSLFDEPHRHALPPSPRSMTGLSDESRTHAFHKHKPHHTGVLTPARTLTSDSASDKSVAGDLHRRLRDAFEASIDSHDETLSRHSSAGPAGPDTPRSISEYGGSLHVVDFPDRAGTGAHVSRDADTTTTHADVGGLVDASTDCKPLPSPTWRSSRSDSTQPALALQPRRTEDDLDSAGRVLRSRTAATKTPRPCWPPRRSPRQSQKDASCQCPPQQKYRVCRRTASRDLQPLAQRHGARRAAMAVWCRRTLSPGTTVRRQRK